ncbi:pyridoxal phosphate-dependent aminotransferase [Desulfovibrio sp. OttesenSCG-928-I05]|nr:pyridoxal phosphate-dependent aminotransferase [Desulfovibrio sp. OttesenSCG-928-I05]
MVFSDRIAQLASSATLAMATRADELRAQGRDIISLSVGEPDFPTPDYIGDAAKKAIDEHFTRYTAQPGITPLRAAVAGYFTREYGIAAEAANVIITNGGKQGLYNAFIALINPGDEVIIPAPYWVSYPAMAELAGAKVVYAKASADVGFKLSVEALEAHRNPRTKILVLNSPSNPTGVCYTQAEVDAIAAWCLEKNIILLSDEIYDQLVYAPAKMGSVARWWEKYPEHFIVSGGASKTFAMTGWRVGYLLADKELIKAMTRFQSHTTANICSISQRAALAAYTGDLSVVATMRTAFQRRRDLAMERISRWEGVACPKPDGAFYIFPDMHGLYGSRFTDSISLCERILEETGVATVPGAAFGDDNCIRLSYAVSDEVLSAALQRIEEYLYR